VGYYMGDFYRGDPGFLSFLGKAVKTAGGFIPGVGGIVSKVGGRIAEVAARPGVRRVTSAIVKHPVLSAAGAAGTIGAVGGMMGSRQTGAATSSISTRRMGGAGGGFGRRRKRMRVTNPKALRRALRRAYGFEKLAMKTIHLLHPKKKVRFGGFRRPKKRK
jgi:hypothetical protein